jgi:hypothetical protein
MISDKSDEAKTSEELKKLANISADMDMSSKLRTQAIDRLGEMDTHEALLILLNLAANDKLAIDERELALKRAREIVKKGI